MSTPTTIRFDPRSKARLAVLKEHYEEEHITRIIKRALKAAIEREGLESKVAEKFLGKPE